MSEAKAGDDVLIRHPDIGSVWMTVDYIKDGLVVGEVWDDSDVGSSFMPDDYRGQPTTMNFPVGCIAKVEPAR